MSGRADAGGGPSAAHGAPAPGGERLQRFLARAGLGSRRGCEALIAAGRVRVNGLLVRQPGVRVDPARDAVHVDQARVRPPRRPLSLVLHKPAGCVTTLRDPEGRPAITGLLPARGLPRLFPVGRLDFDAEGLVLLTNDGALAERLSHPRYGVPRTYHVKVKGQPDAAALERLARGVAHAGERLRAARAGLLRRTSANAWLRIVVTEGRHHLVKRLCEAIGHPVLRLQRVRFGPLGLGDLAPGRWRRLTAAEAAALARLRDAPAGGRREARAS
jgi:23S rRNA pseudouridine2605 synthase